MAEGRGGTTVAAAPGAAGDDPRRAPAGIVCSLVTPFGARGELDRAAYGELLDLQADRGVHGLFLLGTAGEGLLMAAEERMDALAFAVERLGGRVPVLAHCGAADTRTACALARHAASLGVRAEASVAPHFFAYRPPELLAHFRAIAEAAPGMGHYVYENPERVGYSVGVATVVRLVREVENVFGVKDTGDSVGRIGEYLAQEPTVEVYAGNNAVVLPALVVGARGAVSAIASACPELVLSVYGSWRAGRLDEAARRQRTLTRLQAALAGLPYLAAIKHLCRRRGMPGGRCRAPQPDLSDDEARELDRRLDALPELRPFIEPLG
ncbi:MAG TPA: dihydrodipicolinate synthase family protein [Actinomycetota bacterium]|nr:dihydrodipicolinate synthase family protein [Actinomycetota bacterium]